jgi:hypothetical protein
MTTTNFAPKDAETLKQEITTDLGIAYEDNPEMVDKLIARELKGEEFKASLHADKVKHLSRKEFYKEKLAKAGLDPQTGEKVGAKAPEKGTSNDSNMSLKDIRALSDVPDELVDEVIEYANFKKISIAEAKKTAVIKTTISDFIEAKKTAEATSVKTSRGKTVKPSGDELRKKIREGNLPEEDMAEAARELIEQKREEIKARRRA